MYVQEMILEANDQWKKSFNCTYA